MKKVRFVIVGTGWISQVAFLPGTARVANAEITAFVTGDPKKAARLAKMFGVKKVYTYARYDEMFDAGVIDAVYIALPNHLHAKYAIAALKRGIHALVEKPLAATVSECQAMIAAAKKGKAKLMTAYRLHSEPGMIQFLDLIKEGAIGEPRMMTSPFSFSINADNHRLKAVAWGGPLQDIGVYCVNAARHIFGAEPSEVAAMSGRGPGDKRFKEADEIVSAIMRFPKDALAVFSSSFGAYDQDKIIVSGSRGSIEFEGAYKFDTASKITLTNDKGFKVIEVPHHDHFAGQSSYFADCILKNKKVKPDGEEGMADVLLLRAIEKSARLGQSQKIPRSARKVPRLDDTLRKYPFKT